MMQERHTLQNTVFLALCCVLGLFGKRIISPFSNLITDTLHIPGGIATAFSLMFLVIARHITGRKCCGALMGAVQSLLAVAFGMTGSMGMLAPVGYILPGVVIDLVFAVSRQQKKQSSLPVFFASILASVTAALTADIIVFHLAIPALTVYLCVAACSGAFCGILALQLCTRLQQTNIVHFESRKTTPDNR